VTFTSPTEGWVLGSVACASARCPAIAHTLDAGRTWSTIAAPRTTVHADRGLGAATAGVSGLRFADPLDGWAFGPDLWATHDGGQTWTRVRVAGLTQGPVVALDAAHGLVHAVLYDGQGAFRIASSPAGSDDWTIAAIKLPVGAGPVPEVQLVLSGAGGWVLQNDRTVVNGARLVNGVWRAWQPVCASVVGPAFLAASSGTTLVAACDVGAWSTPAGEHLFVSSDGGLTFHETGRAVPDVQGTGIASPDTSTIVVAGSTQKGLALLGSFDGGGTWTTLVVQPTQSTFADLGFTTPSQGVVIAIAGALLMTHDGGRTWAPVAF
jgi:hypothetical protein